MSPYAVQMPNMSSQLRDPGSKRSGFSHFAPQCFPSSAPFAPHSPAHNMRVGEFLGDGANLKTNSLLVVRLFASPPRLPSCRTGGSRSYSASNVGANSRAQHSVTNARHPGFLSSENVAKGLSLPMRSAAAALELQNGLKADLSGNLTN